MTVVNSLQISRLLPITLMWRKSEHTNNYNWDSCLFPSLELYFRIPWRTSKGTAAECTPHCPFHLPLCVQERDARAGVVAPSPFLPLMTNINFIVWLRSFIASSFPLSLSLFPVGHHWPLQRDVRNVLFPYDDLIMWRFYTSRQNILEFYCSFSRDRVCVQSAARARRGSKIREYGGWVA